MKLISWNIQWGRGMDGRVDLTRIVSEVQALGDFDILCLQEVADGFSDLEGSAGENQFAEIGALLPGYLPVEGAAVDLAKAGGGRRRFGNMILSRLPIDRILRHVLPWPAEPTTRNMPRMLLDVEVRSSFGPVRIMTTHLEYFSPALRTAQVHAIREIYRASILRAMQPHQEGKGPYAKGALPGATILAGDFNMPPHDPLKLSLSEPVGGGVLGLADAWMAVHPQTPHPPSFGIADQTYGPPHCCDFVFVSHDLAPRLRGAAYDISTRASDHQPVLVEFADV
jgi:endonuclease/exonuclease/phosphatase family metal-dependent hydrolase